MSRSLNGLQFENARIGDGKIQVLVEYFKGPSLNGQFLFQSTDWVGLDLHPYSRSAYPLSGPKGRERQSIKGGHFCL